MQQKKFTDFKTHYSMLFPKIDLLIGHNFRYSQKQ